jgi:uncharacterized protein
MIVRLKEKATMTELTKQPTYFVVQCSLKYQSFEEAKAKAPHEIAEDIKRSKELHEKGVLVMAGAFLDTNDEPLSTMGVLTSRDAAEDYIKGDPFYVNGMMSQWSIREWANMFA